MEWGGGGLGGSGRKKERGGIRPTALGDDGRHDPLIRETSPCFAHDPIRVRGTADADEEPNRHDGHDHVGRNQAVHVPPIPRRVLDPQQEQADADLAEHDRHEGLHPIQPADHGEVPLVRRLEVVHVPPEPVAVFFRHKAQADQVGERGDEHPVVVRTHVAGQSGPNEDPYAGGNGGEGDEGPCCADVGGALILVAVGREGEGDVFDHGSEGRVSRGSKMRSGSRVGSCSGSNEDDLESARAHIGWDASARKLAIFEGKRNVA